MLPRGNEASAALTLFEVVQAHEFTVPLPRLGEGQTFEERQGEGSPERSYHPRPVGEELFFLLFRTEPQLGWLTGKGVALPINQSPPASK